ncbi:MAG: hypothetical protein OXE55_01395 [Flavobacteriaceae bacterium]|nr:hypothetical protein [Flavobacteriaceae bacterium]
MKADALCFLDDGIFNTSIARKFKNSILLPGDSAHSMESFEKPKDRKPKLAALTHQWVLKTMAYSFSQSTIVQVRTIEWLGKINKTT